MSTRDCEVTVLFRIRRKQFASGALQCTGWPTAPGVTRYRCFLPDLAGLAGFRRVGPGTR